MSLPKEIDPLGISKFKLPILKLGELRKIDSVRYRVYPSISDKLMILYHGLAGDSRYLVALANFLSSSGFANVITPDIYGHGLHFDQDSADLSWPNPQQYRNDFEKLMAGISSEFPVDKLILAGHSLGASLVMKIASQDFLKHRSSLSEDGQVRRKWQILGQVLFAPYFNFEPSVSDGFDLASVFSNEGMRHWLDSREDSVEVHYPVELRTGTEVTRYLKTFFADIAMTKEELRIIADQQVQTWAVLGQQDPLLNIEPCLKLLCSLGVSQKSILLLPDADHFSICYDRNSLKNILNFLMEHLE